VSSRERNRPPAKHGKHRKRRPGVHKRSTSPETQVWNTEQLIPERPAWMDRELYCKLADLRRSL
jgi:hypothetical protein